MNSRPGTSRTTVINGVAEMGYAALLCLLMAIVSCTGEDGGMPEHPAERDQTAEVGDEAETAREEQLLR